MTSILLVEDEYLERMAIRHILESSRPNYNIIGEVDNGKDAIKLALQHKPNLILMDIQMPIVSGIEAAKLIREKIDTDIIFLTAHDEFEYARAGIRLNVSDYLLKPIRKEKLLQSIDDVFQKQSIYHETSVTRELTIKRDLKAANIKKIHDDLNELFHKIAVKDFTYIKNSIEDEVLFISSLVPKNLGSSWKRSVDEIRKIRSDRVWFYSLLWLIDQIGFYFYDERKQREDNDLDLSTQFIELHLREKLTLSKVSNEVGFSSSYYSRIFKEKYDKNLTDYIQSRRIGLGELLLKNTSLSINEIAEDCGFNEANYFSRVFKERTGLSPTDYQNKYL